MLHRHRVKSVRAAAAKLKRQQPMAGVWCVTPGGEPGYRDTRAGGRAAVGPAGSHTTLVVHVIAWHVVYNTVIYLPRRIRADRYIQSSDRITRSNIIHM